MTRQRITETEQLQLPDTIQDVRVQDMLAQIFYGNTWIGSEMIAVKEWVLQNFSSREGLLKLLQNHITQRQLDRLVRIFNLDGRGEKTLKELATELGVHRNTLQRARDLCFTWMRTEAISRWSWRPKSGT